MIEADSHLKLLPASILDIHKVFVQIAMLSIGAVAALHGYTHPTWLRVRVWVLGHVWSENDVIMSWLRLTATSNCFLHPY